MSSRKRGCSEEASHTVKPKASLGICVMAFTSRYSQYTPVCAMRGCNGALGLNHYDVNAAEKVFSAVHEVGGMRKEGGAGQRNGCGGRGERMCRSEKVEIVSKMRH